MNRTPKQCIAYPNTNAHQQLNTHHISTLTRAYDGGLISNMIDRPFLE